MAKHILEGANLVDKGIAAKGVDDAYKKVEEFLKPDFAILIKGSRSVGLERLVEKLS